MFSPFLVTVQLTFAQADAAPNPMEGILRSLALFGPIMLLFYFMLLRPQKRERDRKKSMLAGLKKNDHVVTVAGIKGVVANVKPEEDEVVLRVDDTTGAKLRVLLSSIARVIDEESDPASGKKES